MKPNPLEPRTLPDIRWCASALVWPDNHITAAVFRYRLQFFALNASEDELQAFAKMVQL